MPDDPPLYEEPTLSEMCEIDKLVANVNNMALHGSMSEPDYAEWNDFVSNWNNPDIVGSGAFWKLKEKPQNPEKPKSRQKNKNKEQNEKREQKGKLWH